jgi:hypothetical protein
VPRGAPQALLLSGCCKLDSDGCGYAKGRSSLTAGVDSICDNRCGGGSGGGGGVDVGCDGGGMRRCDEVWDKASCSASAWGEGVVAVRRACDEIDCLSADLSRRRASVGGGGSGLLNNATSRAAARKRPPGIVVVVIGRSAGEVGRRRGDCDCSQ